jgi:hypothetical protein
MDGVINYQSYNRDNELRDSIYIICPVILTIIQTIMNMDLIPLNDRVPVMKKCPFNHKGANCLRSTNLVCIG